MRTGSETYAAVPAERVDILFGGSPRPYKQIGIVSVLGGAFSSDVAMLAKLRKSRSRSGSRRGDCYRAISRTNDGARITDHPRFGDHHRDDHANGLRSLRKSATRSAATTVGMPAMAFSYPKNQGIAIKYLDAAPSRR